ncbi:uncharacterized protein MONOS_6458 [Monocercomonoides exilis]|uniref:uncharacterized protein n=1 Tax=Monocercomonoides exilis TaxID=2049356 RepID=UPI003559653E|nr:hypothetical protein MONOS_6458 [Monocercomonoides exilis]|eukprot:MONOS_6458.1-p1 / transcript=MONOS_6458.1 / gene=MONOS_6458 / organism=Monocercomonoides_exilis_PA203 / gene_product=unspecified product / transcript_product=unspecified product / location=Mono_scaffold00203:51972-52796(+) / protein_length=275 / sequence_SO=supercontig / SO=protein_coding / is_pseudo=false
MEMRSCEFISSAVELKLGNTIVSVESGELKMWEMEFSCLHLRAPLIVLCEDSNVLMLKTNISEIICEGDVICIGRKSEVEMVILEGANVSVCYAGSVVKIYGAENSVRLQNCSFAKCKNPNKRGKIMEACECADVKIGSNIFKGEEGEQEGELLNKMNGREEELCRWNGSLMDVVKSSVMMKETTIWNSPEGGITMSGGNIIIVKGEFISNNPSIEGYSSLRRNIICSDSGTLNLICLKGGDGLKDNTSLWMLNGGCDLRGIAGEESQHSSFQF